MNRSLSIVVLAAIPASLRGSTLTSDNRFVRLMRLVAERRAQTMSRRRLARAERDAALIASMRDGLSTGPARPRGDALASSIRSDYDVLRQIR